jgi:ClpP class serine protease
MIQIMTKTSDSIERPAELSQMFVLDTHAGEVASLFARRAEIMASLGSPPGRGAQPLYAISGSSAVPVKGSLVDWGPVDLSRLGATSYGFIAEAVHAATADRAVERVVLDVDSPGGVVAGSDVVLDALRVARAAKPLVASINGLGASAAF